MDFDTAAKDIVSNAICTAVCIDNAFAEPYTIVSDTSNPSFRIPKGLYESFKKQNCLIDFYKYDNYDSWESKKDFILKNKDLVILDWYLTDGEQPFKDALEILLEAIKTDSLPFVYIYTDERDLGEIAIQIYSYFSGISSDDLKHKYSSLCEKLEDFFEGEDANKLLRGMKEKFKEIVLHPEKSKKIRREIDSYLKKKLESRLEPEQVAKSYSRFLEIGKEIFESTNEDGFLEKLGLFLNNGYFRKEPVFDIDIRPIENENYAYLMHNTLVKVSTKDMIGTAGSESDIVSPNKIYSEFSKTSYKRPRNFLALLGLEMRNLYRDSSSIIGKDINEIDELAFFHHQESLEEEDESRFHEFLVSIWKDEVSSFLFEQKPILFPVLNNYKIANQIDNKLEIFRKNTDCFMRNLAKLNYYYSIIRMTCREPRKIRFGDILSIEKINYENLSTEGTSAAENDTPANEEKSNSPNDSYFLLCITSHCDCLRPNKIRNNLYFVEGKEVKLQTGLKRAESGFISFIKIREKIICIEWKTTPVQFNIPGSNNDITKPIECIISGKKMVLKHLALQKDNYTQRIANESFSWANRVGIDLAKIETKGG